MAVWTVDWTDSSCLFLHFSYSFCKLITRSWASSAFVLSESTAAISFILSFLSFGIMLTSWTTEVSSDPSKLKQSSRRWDIFCFVIWFWQKTDGTNCNLWQRVILYISLNKFSRVFWTDFKVSWFSKTKSFDISSKPSSSITRLSIRQQSQSLSLDK